MQDPTENDISSTTPMRDDFDAALDRLRAFIESVEAERKRVDQGAEIPADVPRFEVV